MFGAFCFFFLRGGGFRAFWMFVWVWGVLAVCGFRACWFVFGVGLGFFGFLRFWGVDVFWGLGRLPPVSGGFHQ